MILLSCSKDSNTDALTTEDQIEESDDGIESEEEEVDNAVIYFPPIDTDTWEQTTVADLAWNVTAEQPLLDFLEENNTKSFMVLYEGRIVMEAYFGNHSASLPWYWASAGKTLTSTTVGIAQDEGLLSIHDPVADYIGTGWTSAPADKENLITNKNLLSHGFGTR